MSKEQVGGEGAVSATRLDTGAQVNAEVEEWSADPPGYRTIVEGHGGQAGVERALPLMNQAEMRGDARAN